jgi:hypothetical protein
MSADVHLRLSPRWGRPVTTYKITAVRGRLVVMLERGSVLGAVRTIRRLRDLGWSVGVSS